MDSQEVQAELDRKKHEYQLRMRKVRLHSAAHTARTIHPSPCRLRALMQHSPVLWNRLRDLMPS